MAAGGRPKGLPKTGGRAKGVQNKRTSVYMKLLEYNYCPIASMIARAKEADVPVDIKQRIDETLTRYSYSMPAQETEVKEIETFEDVNAETAKQALLSGH
jgi:hypothetical protein